MNDVTDEYLPTRKTLLSRLRDLGDQESWQQFFRYLLEADLSRRRQIGFVARRGAGRGSRNCVDRRKENARVQI